MTRKTSLAGMQTIFSTADVRALERFDYWHQVCCRLVFKNNIKPRERATFAAELQAESLVDISLLSWTIPALSVERTARQVARLIFNTHGNQTTQINTEHARCLAG
ncbi:MAG TPA: hypothetical protein VGJ20_30860 [Xanthobacteraceae bacterium]|jgi:hypothetical protein